MEEILALKLDADWVVLSACNTGAGAGAGAEAASGLGRAFFYAGTRALLVTNWSVHSQSARELVTDLFKRQADDKSLTRGEALRQAMMAMVDGRGYTDAAARPSSPMRTRCSGRPIPSSATAGNVEMADTLRMRGSLLAGLAVGFLTSAGVMSPLQAAVHSGASAVRECRATVGRPIVQACVRLKVRHEGGRPRAHVQACRTDAIPAVRACIQRTVPHLVEHCRQTVGRPMVKACVQDRMQSDGGPPDRFVEQCRLSISWAVRACVWRSAAASPTVEGS